MFFHRIWPFAVHFRGDWQLDLWDVMQQQKIAVLQHAAVITAFALVWMAVCL